jgi:hypothetical protein
MARALRALELELEAIFLLSSNRMPPEAPSSKAKLLIPATPGWFNFLPSLPTASTSVASASQLALLLNRASSLHASEVSTFSLSNVAGNSASDRAFLRNILSGGTLSDRLSALTLIVQGAPLHNVRALEALRSLTERGRGVGSVSQEGEKGKGKATGREDRLKAARAIMDWWVGGGAPNRKLRCVSSIFAERLMRYAITTQVLPRPAALTPKCNRSTPHRLVLRSLVEEVLLLLPSDSRGVTSNPLLSNPYSSFS